jgi:hypothetical protein
LDGLLGMLAPEEGGVQGVARPVCVVSRAAVPQMTVEHDARPRVAEEQDLLGMRVGWIGHYVPGLPSPAVRTGHHPGGPVGFGKRVKQPDGVAHLIGARCDRTRPVCVQALMTLAS